jgi:hypothetical protein
MQVNERHRDKTYLSVWGTQKGTYAKWVGQRLTDGKIMIPDAFAQLDSWRAERQRLGHLLLALDFDGTLAPIVSRPEDARMLAEARGGIERLLKRADTDIAFISGRSLADLHDRCAFEGVYYSGNHGLEMDGPGVRETREQAIELRPRVRAVAQVLKQSLDVSMACFWKTRISRSASTRA